MGFLSNLERVFEKYIEGFFQKKFTAGVQPVEIAKKLVREMDDKRTVSVSKIYVPNRYNIYLHPEDLARITSFKISLAQELCDYLEKQAEKRGYYIVGQATVTFLEDSAVNVGTIKLDSAFVESDTPDGQTTEAFSETQVFTQSPRSITVIPFAKKPGTTARLVIIEGIDQGDTFPLGANRTNIGRRETNEVPLSDLNSSRLHAYVVFEDGHHVLIDAKSLNGTYVNGQRITRKILHHGDKIKIGNTILLYEVV